MNEHPTSASPARHGEASEANAANPGPTPVPEGGEAAGRAAGERPKGYWYKEYRQGRRFFLKLLPGERLADILTQFTRRESVAHAVIVSAVGSVKNVRLNDIKSGARLPITAARLTPHEVEGPLELLGLTGNIVPDDSGAPFCHLHIIASKSSGDVVGGHLQDAEVFASCEIVLTELLVEGIARHQSKSAGTANVFFARED